MDPKVWPAVIQPPGCTKLLGSINVRFNLSQRRLLVLIAHSTIGQEHIQMRLHEPGRLAALVVDLQPNRGGGIGRSTCRISSLPISSLLERWHSETATSHLSNREAFGFQGLAADDALRCQPRRGCVRRYSWLRREVIVCDVDGVRGPQQRNEARCWRLAAYMTPEVHLTFASYA